MDRDGKFVVPFNIKRTPEEAAADRNITFERPSASFSVSQRHSRYRSDGL